MSQSGSKTTSTSHGYYVLHDNGLELEQDEYKLEEIWEYHTGGHHPVHLDDIINQRYKVIHKLDSGGFANVWLCSDLSSDINKYVAVKIIVSRISKDSAEMRVAKLRQLGLDDDDLDFFCPSIDEFEIDGPNGVHQVLVFPVLGPQLGVYRSITTSKDVDKEMRQFGLQATKALAALHAQGICHGGSIDFRPHNILVEITSLHHLSEDGILKLFGQPIKNPVLETSTGLPHSRTTAPQYLIYPIEWSNLNISFFKTTTNQPLYTNKIKLIDFGESFPITDPPLAKHFGLPPSYCAPEYYLDRRVGVESDIWALGCTLFEIMTGERLFSAYSDETEDDFLRYICFRLGRGADELLWEGRRRGLEDGVDEVRRLVDIDVDKNMDVEGNVGEDGGEERDDCGTTEVDVLIENHRDNNDVNDNTIQNTKISNDNGNNNINSQQPKPNSEQAAPSSPLQILSTQPHSHAPRPRPPTPIQTILSTHHNHHLLNPISVSISESASQSSNQSSSSSSSFQDLLHKLLPFNPDMRISANEVLEHRWFRNLE